MPRRRLFRPIPLTTLAPLLVLEAAWTASSELDDEKNRANLIQTPVMWATLIFMTASGLFLAMTIGALLNLRWVRRLPALDPAEKRARSSNRPFCSVVIAARNEEARVERTVNHLLAQSGVDLELIVVDDRSTDRTSEILRVLAEKNPTLRLKRVHSLPDGWLGKCHACHVGASSATGEWILFTDADCWLEQNLIARAVQTAEREGADHITLTAGTAAESLAVRAWHLLFLTSLLNWISGVNQDRPKSHVGFGAFNLVRANAYRACGGYEALRLTVLDDVRLGLLVRRAGKRTRAFLGASDVQCDWGTTLASMVRIMEKNYFAALDYRLWLACLGCLLACAIFGTAMAGALSGTPLGITAAVAPFSLIIPSLILAKRSDWSVASALLVPLMLPVMLYTLVNSAWVTLRQGGVRWRDTFYSLERLRAGTVR